MRFFTRKIGNKPLVIFCLIVAVCVLYNEVFVYNVTFRKAKCERPDQCTRILLVADPQLIGLQRERPHFITPLTIWDSDRYLTKTYSSVFNHVKPHLVIFLGDLLDEGSIATNEEFNSYMKRFCRIFNLNLNAAPSKNLEYIFIPGDNDIGGESGEIIKRANVYRFEKTFLQPDFLVVRNMSFYKINRLTRSAPTITEATDFYNTDNIRIGVSHVPLIFMPSLFVDKVLKSIQPHVLFTAHEHKSMVVSTDGLLQKDRQIIPISQNDNKWYDFALGVDNMYEIIVPTCSYRMGTTRIGYGFAVIENGEMHYSVLWSPSRFPQLLVYLCVGIFAGFYALVYFCKRFRGCF